MHSSRMSDQLSDLFKKAKNRLFFVPVLFPSVHMQILVLIAITLIAFLPQSTQAKTCLTAGCHEETDKLRYLHAPMAEGDCLACHEQKNENHPATPGDDFLLLADGAGLCFNCHGPFPQWEQMHPPAAEGNCLACHQPHGSSGPALLETSGAPQNQRAICFDCHDEDQFLQPYGHGPVALGACTACHNPHGSDNPSLLRQKSQALCLGCHGDIADGLRNAAYIHSAVTQRDCTACHQPHGGARPKLLREEMRDLCFGCHQDIREKTRRSTSRHEPLYADNLCGNCHLIHFSKHKNLLFKEEMALCLDCHQESTSDLRNIEKKEGSTHQLHGPLQDKKCDPCHDPHGSTFAYLLRSNYPGSFYASYEKESYSFCFQCHDERLLQEQSVQTGFRNASKNLHALHVAREVKGRTCRACHAPHVSSLPKLISQQGAPFGSWRIPLRYEKTESGGACMPGCHRQMDYNREKK